MKESQYNICLPYNDKHIIFNAITRKFFPVSNQNKDMFMQILSSPDDYYKEYSTFIDKMIKDGFVVDDDTDELGIAYRQYEEAVQSKSYNLMILPTYSCNVSCWYCTQHHCDVKLSDNDVEGIIRHISYVLDNLEIESLRLMWFGGEPLLNYKQLINISHIAKQLCEQHNIVFCPTITTNGTLLSRSRLEEMKDLGFSFFQITVDGTKEDHDKVKVIRGSSAYETTLHNICLICEIIPDARINLRYNYTSQNLKPQAFVESLNKHLPMKIRKNIQISLIKVWQEEAERISNESLEELVGLLYKSNYSIRPGTLFVPCYVESRNFNCVFPNGKVDKCDNINWNKTRGEIDAEGKIKWNTPVTFFDFTVFNTINNNDCRSCKYLPICYGPCPREREKAYLSNKQLKCRYQNAKRFWEQRIKFFCREFL